MNTSAGKKPFLRFENINVGVLIFAAVGPSIGLGLRTEHVVLYFLGGYLIIKQFYIGIKLDYTAVLVFLLTLALLCSIAATPVISAIDNYNTVFANVDNSLGPIFAILLAQKLTFNRSTDNFIVTAIITASFISVLEIFDKTNFLFYIFVRDSFTNLGSVWNLSQGNGRYVGLFFQPVEAGLAFSCFLVYWVYLLKVQRYRPMFLVFLFLLIFIGGIISVSKVFIYSSMFILLFSTIFFKLGRQLSIFVVSFIILVFIGASIGNLWDGTSYFLRLFDFSNSDALSVLGAGRYDQSSDLNIATQNILELYPLTGYGLIGAEVTDNFYIYALAQGGLPFLLINILIMGILLYESVILSFHRSHFLFLMFIVAISTALGGPVFYLNRGNIIFWTFIILFYKHTQNNSVHNFLKTLESTNKITS